MEQPHIDELLERYLGLLDEYTQLRQKLSELQSGVYQNIARANFTGERGMRYGQNHYDDRMQATRLLVIDVEKTEAPAFSIVNARMGESDEEDSSAVKAEGEESEQHADGDSTKKPAQKKRNKNRNPLHWFGIFAPMPLRNAQTQSIQAVEEIIPKLVSVNAEMLHVEIEVRRARKRRAKAEAAAKKEIGPTASTETEAPLLEAS
ncbi:hypothetical protein NM208_g10376 [Fusarium decemcellulare]|uniref:Uncharacterized protein n=1 Tax=Fusarium decemcellulare TaxID=57161 RepID=A0ACC1RY45_9HYPO|nr:hypothetical protein NM208_g10376 [Fusarium decemcellulare]